MASFEPNLRSIRPLPSRLRFFSIYETRNRTYVCGSDDSQQFRFLKIDRAEGPNLSIDEDPSEYTSLERDNLLRMIEEGNKNNGGLVKICDAVAVMGFFDFLERWYMLVVTKHKPAGVLAACTVYGIEDSHIIPITAPKPPDSFFFRSKMERDESRYKNLLSLLPQHICRDCYFSYSYDITHSLQYNMVQGTKLKIPQDSEEEEKEAPLDESADFVPATKLRRETAAHLRPSLPVVFPSEQRGFNGEMGGVYSFPYRDMFLWNGHLLDPLKAALGVACEKWIVPVVCGYFRQVRLERWGLEIALTLQARRSVHFAGTRYLKRGMNDQGKVANDCEIEQIVHVPGDSHTLRYTSLVQVRGSIPLFWGQEGSALVPKAPIRISRSDPFFAVTRMHFQHLMERYGGPITLLNLIKSTEKRPRETILRSEYHNAVQYINQRLDEEDRIGLVAWDLHRASKKDKGNVLDGLSLIATYALNRSSFFFSGPRLHCNILREQRQSQSEQSPPWGEVDGFLSRLVVPIETNGVVDLVTHGSIPTPSSPLSSSPPSSSPPPSPPSAPSSSLPQFQEQCGVIRTNCIDSLDRTNVAQFVVGKVALGRQLYELGVMESVHLELDSPLVGVLMAVYEELGHVLALQYGGSEAVNQMTTKFGYKSGGMLSKGRDVFNSVRRHYANTFTDAEKQDLFNLLLGRFRAKKNETQLWDLVNDYYLHHSRPFATQETTTEHIWPERDWDRLYERTWVKKAIQGFKERNTVGDWTAKRKEKETKKEGKKDPLSLLSTCLGDDLHGHALTSFDEVYSFGFLAQDDELGWDTNEVSELDGQPLNKPEDSKEEGAAKSNVRWGLKKLLRRRQKGMERDSSVSVEEPEAVVDVESIIKELPFTHYGIKLDVSESDHVMAQKYAENTLLDDRSNERMYRRNVRDAKRVDLGRKERSRTTKVTDHDERTAAWKRDEASYVSYVRPFFHRIGVSMSVSHRDEATYKRSVQMVADLPVASPLIRSLDLSAYEVSDWSSRERLLQLPQPPPTVVTGHHGRVLHDQGAVKRSEEGKAVPVPHTAFSGTFPQHSQKRSRSTRRKPWMV